LPIREGWASRSAGRGAAYRLVYEIHGDVVLLLALGEHDAAYRDAERRR